MIKVIPANSGGFEGLHCTAYPSPSALEACSICEDKFRMEQLLKGENGGEYESSADAERGTAIHKACAILLTTLINNAASTGRKVYQMALFASISDELNKIAGWSNEYWSLAYKSVQSVMCELYRMEEKHKNVNVYVETVVDLSKYLEGYYGTADVIAIGGSELLVADYKFGYRKVNAHENKQLVCYASGYLNDDIKHVTLLIVQSSINHYSRYFASDNEIKALMEKNICLIRSVCSKGIHFRCVSDASCAYCTARTACSAYKNSNFAGLMDAINSDRELTSDEKALIIRAEKIDSKAIIDEIIKTAQVSWEQQISQSDISDWLSNFRGEALGSETAERNLALWLLSSFVYFSIRDVRAFCKYIYNEFVHKKLVEYKEKGILQELSLQKQIEHILEATVFLAIGNDSESGSNVLYYFRQVNKLKKEVFEKKLNVPYENLVFVDDVSISGIQAMNYISQIQESMIWENSYYLVFLASKTAIDELTPISVTTICANQIDEREKCFSEDSYVFTPGDRHTFLPIAAKMCNYYGEIITKGHPEADGYPLGFDQAQCLFCFFYNTPDNTLPIFWCRGSEWKPIFTRYEKEIDPKEDPINHVVFV